MKQPTPVEFNNRGCLQFILRQSILTTGDFTLRQIKLFFHFIHPSIPTRETFYATNIQLKFFIFQCHFNLRQSILTTGDFTLRQIKLLFQFIHPSIPIREITRANILT